MHDCRQIEERLIELVFDELAEGQRAEMLALVGNCPHCRAQVESYKATLTTFDEAAILMLPDESYWNGYESRLRSRLAAAERPHLPERWIAIIADLFRRPAWVLATATLLLAALVIWTVAKSSPSGKEASSLQSEAVTVTDKVLANIDTPESGVAPPTDKPKSHKNPWRGGSSQQAERQVMAKAEKPERQENLQAESSARVTTEAQVALMASAIDVETIRHFEKTQMLLRSFRNLRSVSDAASVEIAQEKERCRALLFQNILLRREANAKGFTPVEEVLSNVEPVLIDIANLPDKAPLAEIRAIRQRIQKREIVATLQVYLAKPAVVGAITE